MTRKKMLRVDPGLSGSSNWRFWDVGRISCQPGIAAAASGSRCTALVNGFPVVVQVRQRCKYIVHRSEDLPL